MKRNTSIFLVCVMILSCLCGCAQNRPAATQAPTTPPTTVPPTTEAPTEPLSEEELAQLKYEQMFADSAYVMDWGCIDMDVTSNILFGAHYNVEILSDENGVYWEALRAYEDDPCYKNIKAVYYRNADDAYFYVATTGYLGINGHSSVNADFETEGTLMRENWNRAQTIFAEVIAKQEKVLYLGSEEGLDIVIINPYATEPLLFYIDPETNEVQELYMKTLEKLYHIEFVENNPNAITKLAKKTLSGSISLAQMTDICDEVMGYLENHVCKRYGDWYEPKVVHMPAIEAEETAEEIAQKQKKWATIMANEAYVIDYDSWLRTALWDKDGDLNYTAARVVNEQGVQFEQYVETDNNCYTKYYRVDENTGYCYSTYYENRHRWYSVDVTSPYTTTRVDKKEEINRYNLECFYDTVVYTKSVNGLDVLVGPHFWSDSTIELHINPETYEIKYVYMHVDGTTTEIELIYEDEVYIQKDIPTATHGTITFADVARLQDEVHVSGGGS